MFKTIKIIVLVILTLVIVIWFSKALIAEKILTKKIRVPISIEWMSLSPTKMGLKNFRIDNPKGFLEKAAFTVGETEVDYGWMQLIANPVVIDQISLNQIFLDVEFIPSSGTKNNWTVLSEDMPKPKSYKKVLIRTLVLNDLTIEIRGLKGSSQPMTRHIDHLEFENINSQHGFPTEELVHKIFGSSGLESFIENAFSPEGVLKDAFDPLSIF